MHLEAGILPEAVVIPNFVDVLDAAGTPVPENGPIVFVGTEIPDKGLSVILRAFSQWEDRGSRELHVVGAIHNREPSAGVSYLGFLTGDALWDAYRSASLVVVPSTWQEPCPTVALEAMVFGRPVIGSAVGGLIEIVEHGHTGILVPPNDEAALIEAMRDLTEDAALSRLMGQNARTRVRDYSAGHVVPIIEELYVALRDSA
jgi:glycosyltransferase involved in cell wall biosynthesis